MGKTELDNCLMTLQPHIRFCHFKDSMLHLSQWSGRMDKELMSVIVTVSAGSSHVPGKALQSLQSFCNFLYICQYQSHSMAMLTYLHNALKEFHSTKAIFLKTGARKGKKVINHFRLPKLCGLHAYEHLIPELGSAPQFDTEITKHIHISDVKFLF